jgi:hypothetical protein
LARLKHTPEFEEIEMKHALYLAAIAICLITPAAEAQQSNLDLRFDVPFPFSINDKTFAAGNYQITYQSRHMIIVRNRTDQTAAFVSVLPAQSRNEGNRPARLLFHRYGDQYFLTSLFCGGWESTYDFKKSRAEERLAYESPRDGVITVIVDPNGTPIAANTPK